MMEKITILLIFIQLLPFGALQGIKISKGCNGNEFAQRSNGFPNFIDALQDVTIDRQNFIITGEVNELIEIVGISGNKKIQFLPLQVQKLYPNMIAYNAFDCSLKSIQRENFSSMKNLKILRLNNNKIETISVEVFDDLKSLEMLNLDDNKIRWMHENSFRNLGKLEWLWLEGNQLTSLYPEVFEGLPNLRILLMNRNLLKSLDVHQFSKNLKLEKIQLQKNKIESLSEKIFDNLNELKEVDLRGNQCVDQQYGFWLGGKLFLDVFDEDFKEDVIANCTINEKLI